MLLGENKRVSVVVPSYNHAKFIERCLRSIISQTSSPSELLVIDDGSTDRSPQIIERVLRDCTFPATLLVNENKGLCATLNQALSLTNGEYFAYLGSDDLWLPTFLEQRIVLLEGRSEAVLGYGNAFLIDDDDRVIESSADWGSFQFPDGDPREMLYHGTAPVSSTVVYRRDALERRGWNESAKLEDYELYLQLAEDGEFAFQPSVLAAWRRHDRNTSGDLDFMLGEVLAAQERVASKLEWSRSELDEVQTKTRFFFSEEYARAGESTRARSLMIQNLAGAPSFKILMRAIVRNLTPKAILDRRKSIVGSRRAKKYSSTKLS